MKDLTYIVIKDFCGDVIVKLRAVKFRKIMEFNYHKFKSLQDAIKFYNSINKGSGFKAELALNKD